MSKTGLRSESPAHQADVLGYAQTAPQQVVPNQFGQGVIEAGERRRPATVMTNKRTFATNRWSAMVVMLTLLALIGLTGQAVLSQEKSRFTVEHFALAGASGYLDGPRREAMSSIHRQGVCDAQGNLYILDWFGTSLRCARVDGMMVTIVGDNLYGGDLDLDEGPASCLPALDSPGQSFGSTVRTVEVRGMPWEGGNKGAIYVLGGRRSGNAGKMYKIWRNSDKGNRWWFRRVAGGGNKKPADQEGFSLAGREAAFSTDLRFTADLGGAVPIHLYDRGSGNVFRYDDRAGTVTCVLAYASYKDKLQHPEAGIKLGPPEEVVIADDGTAYVSWYRGTKYYACIYRVPPDRRKAELFVYNPRPADGGSARDGLALKTYWFGGPQMNGYQPADLIFAGAVDDRWLRRVKDGRVSTLCPDGEWREFATRGDALKPPHLYAGFGTNSWAMYRNSPYVYRTYGSKSDYATTIIRFGPVDWHKPTVGRQVGDSSKK